MGINLQGKLSKNELGQTMAISHTGKLFCLGYSAATPQKRTKH